MNRKKKTSRRENKSSRGEIKLQIKVVFYQINKDQLFLTRKQVKKSRFLCYNNLKTFLSVAFFNKSATEFQRGRNFDIQLHFKCFFFNKFLKWVIFLNYEWNRMLICATLNSFRNSGIIFFPVRTFDCQHYFSFLTLDKLLHVILINVSISEGL